MNTQEIKLRLVEAFIKDGRIREGYNLENIFKYKDCKSESISKRIDREKQKAELAKIYNETMDSAIKIVENNKKINNKNTHN